ncbi:GNAT family N-acetyltransferase [Polaribacter sp. Hel1_85]|uniref:GNAT family N-acetyltransferase n=1 Tax=Polaribacter sp. Hel1_85 TaxID=1250005 RepID=UPI00052DD97F|nr:GNAT family N-acetyltransferase [Polaribacter sp. Hel1_85]KGL58825.1 acetyltransferase (GNAT) family protein [Polaribacter sp. Hel1_85]
MIVPAIFSDAKQLTEIALKSKAFWGYSNDLIESWRNDLTVTSAMISNCGIFKFLVNNEIVGFYVLNSPKEKTIELEMLFMLPQFIGKGIGKQLLQHLFEKALKLNVYSMTLLADPNAVPFYKSKGFYQIDRKESSISGRFLPIMQKDLKQ